MARGPAAADRTSIDTDDSASVLGRATRVRGRVTGDGSLRVEGTVEGDVTLTGDLALEEDATITGDVAAASVVIAGTLRGDVTSRGPVAIRATATVEGNLGGSEVSLDEGATFTGRIEAEFDLPAELAPRQGR